MNPLAKLLSHFPLPITVALAGANASRSGFPTRRSHGLRRSCLRHSRHYSELPLTDRSNRWGALYSRTERPRALFQIAHTKGTAYFSVRALAKDAATNLNVRWNNRTYVFRASRKRRSLYSVVLQSPPDKSSASRGPLTPPRLLGLCSIRLKRFHCFKPTSEHGALTGGVSRPSSSNRS